MASSFRPYKKRLKDKMERRVQYVGRESIRLRTEIRRELKKALREVTQEQLYDRTPLPVTRDMYDSIVTDNLPEGVQVLYREAKCPYAKYRINMTGRSKLGGHTLDMTPAASVREKTRNKILQLTRAAMRRLVEA